MSALWLGTPAKLIFDQNSLEKNAVAYTHQVKRFETTTCPRSTREHSHWQRSDKATCFRHLDVLSGIVIGCDRKGIADSFFFQNGATLIKKKVINFLCKAIGTFVMSTHCFMLLLC